YIVDGKKFYGKESLLESTQLLRSDYPATTQESKEALVKAFIEGYQDIYLNGGLTQEEVDKYGYVGDQNNPVSLYHVDGPNIMEGLPLVRHVTYEHIFYKTIGSGLSGSEEIEERAQQQYEAFKDTGELAELEIYAVD